MVRKAYKKRWKMIRIVWNSTTVVEISLKLSI